MKLLRTFRCVPVLMALAAGCVFSGFLFADQGGVLPPGQIPQGLEGVGIDEHLGRPIDLNLTFLGEDGKPVALKEFFHSDRPVVLDLVYYSCPMLCDLILNGQAETMRQMDWTPGNQYEVVTISFDPAETPGLAREKKKTYTASYGRPAPGWHFLADTQGNARRLAEEIGFHYRYDERQKQFAHPSAIMILTPEGRIARYLYGIKYRPRDMRFALAEASAGRYTNALDKLLLFCYHYDPSASAYVLFAGRVMRIGGALTVLVLGFFLWRMFRAERARNMGRRSVRERIA